MLIRYFISLVAACVLLAGCAGSHDASSQYAGGSSWNTQQLIAGARDAADESMRLDNRGKAKAAAMHGRELAERCLMTAPEEAGCYYWRAVNTGLYYKIHVIGYQNGIKQMISDCEKVISLDARYDHAGAYRMLGELYLKLPQTAGRPDSITRDMDLSEKYLRKAVEIAPDYPENQIMLSEVLLEQDNISGAIEALSAARDLTPRWKNDASYSDWKSTLMALEHKIGKAKNK